MASFARINTWGYSELRTIIKNGFTRKNRLLLKGQGLEGLPPSQKVVAMMSSKLNTSTFEIPTNHRIKSLTKTVNKGVCKATECSDTAEFFTKVANLYGINRVPEVPPGLIVKNYSIAKAGKEIGFR